MKTILARVHTGLAWLVVLGSVVQFFIIALVIFNGVAIEQHGASGRILTIVALVMMVVAIIIRTSRRTTWYSVAVLLLLFPVQGALAYLDMPGFLNALHAVIGTAILGLSYSLAAGQAKAVEPV
jgi:MFS-type transporter involved in bile tolerance (Atg22 family)